jgi:hypothetical protein
VKELKLEELLRYAFAGGVGLLALPIVFPSTISGDHKDIADAAFIFGLALLFGSLLYGLHRSLVYPLIHRGLLFVMSVFFSLFRFEWEMWVPYRPTNVELALDYWRWRAISEKDFSQPQLAEWGAQVHFLYCSAWAVLTTLYVGKYSLGELVGLPDASRFHVFLRLVYMLLVAALIHNARLIYVLRKLMLKEPPIEATPGFLLARTKKHQKETAVKAT